ncbi:MAG: CsbD family protein [Acidothermaceae bacterium]
MGALDKLKNAFQSGKGHTKQQVGQATDNRSLEAEGTAEKASGNLKQAGENVKDVFKE